MNIIIITKGEVKTTCNQHQPESIHRYCPGQKYFPFLEIFDIDVSVMLSNAYLSKYYTKFFCESKE